MLDQDPWPWCHICILHPDEGGAFISVAECCLKFKRDEHLGEIQTFLSATDSYLEVSGRRPLP